MSELRDLAKQVKDASTWNSGPRATKLFRIGDRLEAIASELDEVQTPATAAPTPPKPPGTAQVGASTTV
jgi:hypothetical protein